MHPSATAISNLPVGHQDLARAIVEGFLAGRSVIAVINGPDVTCKPVIDAVLRVLGDRLTRIVRVEETSLSRVGPPVPAIDQLSDAGEADARNAAGSDAPPDPPALINGGLRMLSRPPFGERRRLLVVEAAQTHPSEALEQLARMTLTGPPELPIQMLFVGDPTYWHRLQAAKFEDTRQRIGVPFMALPPGGSEGAPFTAPPSNNPSSVQRPPQRIRRRGRALAVFILLGAVLGIYGVLQADTDLRDWLLAHILPLWTAFADRVHRLAG